MAEAILRFIGRENIISVKFLAYDKAEVLEIIVPEGFDKNRKRPLKNLELPSGALIGAIEGKNNVFIPRGSDVILPGDQIMLFTLAKHLRTVEQIFRVRR